MRVLYGPRFLPIPYWAQYEYPTLSIAFSISANSYRGIITSQFQCNATTLHQHTSEYWIVKILLVTTSNRLGLFQQAIILFPFIYGIWLT